MTAPTPGQPVAPTLRAAVRDAARTLADAGVPSPEHDARALAEHLLGTTVVLAPPDAAVPEGYAALVARRATREPLQHIVGWAPFRHLRLTVRRGVFVPRPETEVVAEVAITELRTLGALRVAVDLCCGAGGLAIAMATEAGAHVVAVDAAPEAVRLTADNAADAGADVDVRHGDVRDADLLADLAGTVDVVASNPPYIPPGARPVDPEVRDHDPELALYGGGTDGLEVPRAVVAAAGRLLRDGGLLVMEHADVQGPAARAVVAEAGFVDVRTVPDLTGRDRMVVARRASRSGQEPPP